MRTASTDEQARRWFHRYWTLGVGSGAHLLDRALVVAVSPGGSRVIDLDLSASGVRPVDGSWLAPGMRDSDTVDVELYGVSTSEPRTADSVDAVATLSTEQLQGVLGDTWTVRTDGTDLVVSVANGLPAEARVTPGVRDGAFDERVPDPASLTALCDGHAPQLDLAGVARNPSRLADEAPVRDRDLSLAHPDELPEEIEHAENEQHPEESRLDAEELAAEEPRRANA